MLLYFLVTSVETRARVSPGCIPRSTVAGSEAQVALRFLFHILTNTRYCRPRFPLISSCSDNPEGLCFSGSRSISSYVVVWPLVLSLVICLFKVSLLCICSVSVTDCRNSILIQGTFRPLMPLH